MKKKEIQKRHWAFIIYPESMPYNYKDILQQSGLQVAISPLHDMDYDATGELKKPHYHIILSYGGTTTFNNVSNLTKKLNGTIPIALEQVKGMFRYFTHLDNPDKAQYKKEDIVLLNGFDNIDITDLSKTQVLEIKKQIIKIIEKNAIFEYADLCLFLLEEDIILFDVCSNNAYFFSCYINSKRNSHYQTLKSHIK